MKFLLFMLYGASLVFHLEPYMTHDEIIKTVPIIINAAVDYKVDPEIVAIMIGVESSGNPQAVSSVKARGLMQVRWSVWGKMLSSELGLNEKLLHDRKYGIRAGARILRHYYVQNGNYKKALTRYNGSVTYANKILGLKKNKSMFFNGEIYYK